MPKNKSRQDIFGKRLKNFNTSVSSEVQFEKKQR